jgi:hypothetical protein
MRTCRSKALISRHLAMMASSSFGKSMDMLGNPDERLGGDTEVKLLRAGVLSKICPGACCLLGLALTQRS